MKNSNDLFPVFFKLEELRILLVGGGQVAKEKLSAILTNSPRTQVRVVAPEICDGIFELASTNSTIKIERRHFSVLDLYETDLVFAAVNDLWLSQFIRNEARKLRLLVNVADTPELCDFYLSSVVKKNDLKIAISTNGKSPTFAKRLKEVIDVNLPDETQTSIINLHLLREELRGNFREKVIELNKVTASLIPPGYKDHSLN